jgi:putative membrane protein
VSDLERPFDSGLQPERTALAWQRTGLSIALALLVGTRLVAHLGAAWAPALAAAGIIVVTLLLAIGHRRYARLLRALRAEPPEKLPGAAALLGWVIATTALGGVGAIAIAIYVITR